MYVGHFAVGVAIKAAKPKLPALPIMLGVGFLDFVYGLMIVVGADRATPDLKAGPYLFFDLTFIDWDHSLLMAVVLSLFWAALFLKDKGVALAAGLASFSHFLLDLPMHNGDLALYPFSSIHLGFGLWGKLDTGAWVLEGLFSFALLAWAYVRFRARNISIVWTMIISLVLFLNLSPWLSPMKMIAGLQEPAAHILHALFTLFGFLGPGLLLTWLLNRAERSQGAKSA